MEAEVSIFFTCRCGGWIKIKIAHLKIPAITASAAQTHAVGLVKFAVIGSIIAFKKRLLHAFHSQVQSPIPAVDCDIYETAQGGIYAEFVHHGISQIVFHHGGILNQVI